ncbi:MAG: hypothetical protein ACRYFY_19485 [Janthinobacterium lividum]
MYAEQSTYDWRRYGHWSTTAEKARLVAFLLWQTRDSTRVAQLKEDASYSGGDTGLALSEGFHRESAVALELIIKAAIARQLELQGGTPAERVPATHDIPKLWEQAQLPALDKADRYRLLLVRQTLMWSGRYGTPRSVKAWVKENEELRDFAPPVPSGKTVVFWQPPGFGWDEFDRLYQLARERLATLRR